MLHLRTNFEYQNALYLRTDGVYNKYKRIVYIIKYMEKTNAPTAEVQKSIRQLRLRGELGSSSGSLDYKSPSRQTLPDLDETNTHIR